MRPALVATKYRPLSKVALQRLRGFQPATAQSVSYADGTRDLAVVATKYQFLHAHASLKLITCSEKPEPWYHTKRESGEKGESEIRPNTNDDDDDVDVNFLIPESRTFTKLNEIGKTFFTLFVHFSVRPYF